MSVFFITFICKNSSDFSLEFLLSGSYFRTPSRRLGLSISEIKSILANPDELKSVLYKKTLELEQEKAKQDILQKLCNGESLEKLEQEINNINSKTIIIKKLMDLFPSYYGKFISLNFSRYLTGRIETKEQMEAFKEIIDFFDNVPNIKIPKDLQKYLKIWIQTRLKL